VLRRTFLVGFASAAALAVAVSAGGAPDRATADPFIGTWKVKPAAGTPWANGGTVAVSASTRSEVKALGPPEGNNGWESQCIGFESPPWPPGYENPIVSAWYVATFSWSGPKMGGCVSNKTFGSIALFGSPRQFVGVVNPVQSNGTIHGCWSDNFATGCKFFDSVVQDQGTTKTVSEPAPGASKIIEPPALPVDCGSNPGRAIAARCKLEVDVSSSADDLGGLVIVGEGDVQATIAGLFVHCWLTAEENEKLGWKLTAAQKVRICLTLVKHFLGHGKRAFAALSPLQPARRPKVGVSPSASGCRTERMAIAVRLRKGKVVSAKMAKNRKLTASSVRYSCSASGGQEKVTITGPSNIRKALGKKLTLVAARAKKAPRRSAKLTFTFGW
jgi:hypothetical protein